MTAKWKALADRLAAEIENGTRPPGSALPHILSLVDAGEGSRATVGRAYKELEATGYVISTRGHGTVVRDRSRVQVPLSRFERVLEPGGARGPWETATAEQGLAGRMEVETPAAETLEAPADVASFLKIDADAPVIRRRRRAMIDTDVIALQEAWYPADVAEAAGLDRPGKVEGGVLAALIAAGIIPAEADEYVSADTPTAEQAARLSIGGRVSVLSVDRVTRDRTGRTIELVRLVGAADRLRLIYAPLPLKVRTPRNP
ncbi:GntR family transcriptional regulator [Streptomyces tsukubensis]|uniref:GntR family transcriptional regulator n=1 Tax=Streptomyces tsukubensis TaxID=83656 RepID=UPI00344E5581